MTIDEAIDIIDTAQSDLEDPPPSRFAEALLLGIEALREFQRRRSLKSFTGAYRLPGEIEE